MNGCLHPSGAQWDGGNYQKTQGNFAVTDVLIILITVIASYFYVKT